MFNCYPHGTPWQQQGDREQKEKQKTPQRVETRFKTRQLQHSGKLPPPLFSTLSIFGTLFDPLPVRNISWRTMHSTSSRLILNSFFGSKMMVRKLEKSSAARFRSLGVHSVSIRTPVASAWAAVAPLEGTTADGQSCAVHPETINLLIVVIKKWPNNGTVQHGQVTIRKSPPPISNPQGDSTTLRNIKIEIYPLGIRSSIVHVSILT